jgi:hypothetical protein
MDIAFLIFAVCVGSVVTELLLCSFGSVTVRMLGAIIVPFVFVFGVYWLPNPSAWHNAEYRSWFLVFFVMSFIPAVIASTATAVIASWLVYRESKRPNDREPEPKPGALTE